MDIETIRADVLVVGGGLAGTRAALEARASGATVAMVLKGKLGTSGNSPLAGGGFNAALRLADRADSAEAHFADTMAGGGNVNNAALVRVMAEQAPSAILELHKMGVVFAMNGDQIAQYQAPAATHKRAIRTAGGGSFKMMAVLADAVKREDVRVVEDTILLDLALRDNAVVGAIGYAPDRDSLLIFQAPAVVLASGGAGHLFPLTSNSPEITGDGYAMAYRAGAKLADMEFVQFTPTALAWPPQLRGESAGGSLLGQDGARLLNRLGERFMTKYDPERMERSTRAITSRAMFREIVEGRGTEHGAVYLDVTQVDPTALENISGPQMRKLAGHGLDLLKEPIELAPAVHHYMGGVVIDTHCAASIPGLFAAGEAAAGVHGGNRLNSNALAEAAVFGKIAGAEAAAYARGSKGSAVSAGQREAARAAVQAMTGAGPAPEPLIEKLRTTMLAGAGLERKARAMEAALTDLAATRAEAEGAGAKDPASVVRLVELRNMLQVGEIALRAARMRTESRGAHFRSDYPAQNDADWLANIVATRGEAGPKLEVVQIRGE